MAETFTDFSVDDEGVVLWRGVPVEYDAEQDDPRPYDDLRGLIRHAHHQQIALWLLVEDHAAAERWRAAEPLLRRIATAIAVCPWGCPDRYTHRPKCPIAQALALLPPERPQEHPEPTGAPEGADGPQEDDRG